MSTNDNNGTFQQRVQPWMMACFGEMIAGDREERNHRFLEEALELVQATGCTASEAHQLVDYVYGRPVGEPAQEVGGVMVTLAALCLANALDLHQCGETELARIWTKVDAIRAKQAAKPKHSPLPATPGADTEPTVQEQKQAERINWNTKQWYEHVGAWENDTDEIVFGSVMALRAMMVQFQAVTHYALCQRAASHPERRRLTVKVTENDLNSMPGFNGDPPEKYTVELVPDPAGILCIWQPDSERVASPTVNTERAWYKEWLASLTDQITVDQVEFGRRVWAERARRAAAGAGQ
jgi:hypothetical protein